MGKIKEANETLRKLAEINYADLESKADNKPESNRLRIIHSNTWFCSLESCRYCKYSVTRCDLRSHAPLFLIAYSP